MPTAPDLRGAGIDPGSKNRLVPGSARHFPADTLFGRFARAVCEASCLPRKELFEAWEVAARVRRRLRGGRVVDLACGHAALAWAMVVLDGSSPAAVGVDLHLPQSAHRLAAVLGQHWPDRAGRVELVEAAIDDVPVGPEDLVVSVHACGSLTDQVIRRAMDGRAAVAVLPCCHEPGPDPEPGLSLEGWIDLALAQDLRRARTLAAAGYTVWTATIPAAVTPKNRLLVARPGR